MNEDLDRQLRSALGHIEPDAGFAERVLARIGRDTTGPGGFTSDRSQSRMRWISGGIAATLILGVIGATLWQQRAERAAGLEARQQLIEALRVTSDKLDLAYQGVNSPSRQKTQEQSGA